MNQFHDLTERGRALRLRRCVAAALEHHSLEVARLRLITNETNGVFRLDTVDGGRFVVRVGLGGEVGHSPDAVRNEVAWLDALASETAVPVPEVVRTLHGEPFVTVEVEGVPDPRNVVISSWLDGPLLGDRLSTESVFRFGATMAAIHDHGSTFRPPAPSALPVYDRALPFGERDYLSTNPGVVAHDRRADVFGRARSRVESALSHMNRPRQILHGDLHPWNAKIRRGRISVFDFEDLMYGWPLQDIATTLYYFHGDGRQDDYFGAFEDGYRSVAPWPAEAPEQIHTFLIGRALVLANYVLASPELSGVAAEWIPRFESRITALLEGQPFRVEW
jgi:Ser/Thr protein kinase RdoA (MazF antagonist)